jgi:hypothetical protein
MPFERRHEPVLPRREFVRRLLWSGAFALGVVTGALTLGTLGYHGIAGLDWVDAFYNASMILAGMGPATPLSSDAAKVFASVYAIFSGVVFVSSIGIVLAPLVHRFLHRFHLPTEEDDEGAPKRRPTK